MILTDKSIKARVAAGQLFMEGYSESNVNSISYDLTIRSFIIGDEEYDHIELIPGEFIMLQTNEMISMPTDLCGEIGEKNSRIRQGLVVSGPRYFPGHEDTYIFLRVQNISTRSITLHRNDTIAQIFFETLDQEPETPYSKQEGASFNREQSYAGYGKYDSEYKKNEHSFQQIKDSILSKEHQIYANVITFMGIIVAVFAMLTINYQAFTSIALSAGYIIAMNLTLVLCICVLMGLILFVVNHSHRRWAIITYVSVLVILAVFTVVFSTCFL